MARYDELKGKKILVTGGTQGIGEAIVAAFCKEGAEVALNGRVLNEKVQKVIAYTGAVPAMGSLADPEIAKQVVREAAEKLGGLDVLVCNAAGMSMEPFLEQDEASWWDQVNINLTGHLFCIQEALKTMKKNGGGTIIIVSSFFGTIGWNNASGYGSSKTGLLTMGQLLARDYRKDHIRSCIIVPGVIDTPQLSVDANDLGISMDEVRAMYAEEIAMKRIGKPEEIADMALFMSTKAGGQALNGRHIQVSGGEYRTTPYYY